MEITRFDRRALVQHSGLLLATVILLGGASTTLADTADPELYLTLSIFVATVVLWVTKPVPYAISSIFCVILLYGAQLADSFAEAASGFSSSLVFFILLLLLIGKGIENVDLDIWVANRLISATSTPQSSIRRLAVALFSLTFIMPSSVARAVAFMPIVDQINDSYELETRSDFRRFAYYILGHLNMASSLNLMTSGGMAIATAELINEMVTPVTWVEWAIYMVPPVGFLYCSAVIAGGVAFNVVDDVNLHEHSSNSLSSNTSSETRRESLTSEQQYVALLLLTAGISWIIGSFLGIPTIIPAMAVVFGFSIPRFQILTTHDFRNINWQILFIIGAMLSLIEVMREVDAFKVMIDVLSVGLPIEGSPTVVLVLLLICASLLRGMFSSVAAAFIVLFPVLYSFTGVLGANPLYMSFGLAMVLISTTFLPFNNPTVLVTYEKGPFTMWEILSFGLLTLALAFITVGISWIVYWPLVDGML